MAQADTQRRREGASPSIGHMEIHEVNKEKMDALKALSETNLKVSEARALLQTLQEDETEYLVGREKRAVERIEAVLKDSEAVLSQIGENYASTANLSNEVADVCTKITDLLITFTECRGLFATKCDAFDAYIGKQEDSVAKMKQDVQVQKTLLKEKEESLNRKSKQIDIDRRKLIDDRAALERAINRFKKGRI